MNITDEKRNMRWADRAHAPGSTDTNLLRQGNLVYDTFTSLETWEGPGHALYSIQGIPSSTNVWISYAVEISPEKVSHGVAWI